MDIAAIAEFIQAGLIEVGWGLVASQAAEPWLKGIRERLRGAQQQPAGDAALKAAVTQALAAVDAPADADAWQRWALRTAFDQLQGSNPAGAALRQQVALIILSLTDPDPAHIPDDVFQALGLRQAGPARAQLARFFHTLRAQLATQTPWDALVAYFDRQAERALAVQTLAQESAQTRYLRHLLIHLGVFPDEDEGKAMERYRAYVVQKYNRISFLLIQQPESGRYQQRTSAALEAVYVPLQVYDTTAMRLLDAVRDLCAEVMRPGDSAARPDLAKSRQLLQTALDTQADLLARVIQRDAALQADLRRLAEKKSASGRVAARLLKALEPAASPRDRPERPPAAVDEMSIDETLRQHPAFLLRGKPGAGKTTLLKRLAVAFAAGQAGPTLGWSDAALLPILVPLRNFGYFLNSGDYVNPGPRALREFMQTFFKDHELELPPTFVRHWLEQGRCLILLDGLDEVTDRDLRLRVAQYVTQFMQHYGRLGNRFGLSARPQGYADARDQLPPDLVVCEVQPLAEAQRDALVGHVLRQYADSEQQAQGETTDLIDAIQARPQVEELSRNPLFCTTLVLVYKFGGAVLPARRVDVYQAVVELMLGFWETHRAQREGVAEAHELAKFDGTSRVHPTPADALAAKRRALLHLADWLAEHNRVEMEAAAVIERLERFFHDREGAPAADARAWAEGYLRAVSERSGLFIAPDPDRYAFSHKLFLEYLAAVALVGKTDQRLHATLRARVADSWWHEIILLALALDERLLSTERREELFEVLLAAGQLLLAGECAVDAGDRLPAPTRRRVEAALYTRMTDVARTAPERYAAAEVWDALHGPPADVNAWVRCPACSDDSRDLYVGKYPVTNAQYALFIAVGGYEEPVYWGGKHSRAWAWRVSQHPSYRGNGPVTQPEYWRDPRFGKRRAGYPVVGVSWYEAWAYTGWLTTLLGRARQADPRLGEVERALVAELATTGVEAVRLPTDAEWTRLAGGKQDDRYPWDRPPQVTSDQDRTAVVAHCNTGSSNLEGTTPVGMYPAGASHPFDLYDVAGNVWEWTDTRYDDREKEYKVVRGGAWGNNQSHARVAARDWYYPSNSDLDIGFRVVSPVVLAAGS